VVTTRTGCGLFEPALPLGQRRHPAGHHPVRGGLLMVGDQSGYPGGHHADAKAASGWLANR